MDNGTGSGHGTCICCLIYDTLGCAEIQRSEERCGSMIDVLTEKMSGLGGAV